MIKSRKVSQKAEKQKICQHCKSTFLIIPAELKFYEKKGLDLPNLCPRCRLERRAVLRNEQNLYTRKCDKCKKQIVSVYPQKTQFTVYCQECYNDYLSQIA